MGMVAAYSQTEVCNNTLTGQVIDLHDQTPLSGATVILTGAEIAVLTDFDGYFTLKNLCEGDYTLQISHPECRTRAFEVSLEETMSRTFKLEHHLESLNEVIVSGRAFSTKTESLLNNYLDETSLERLSAGSLGDALRTLSGVSSLNTGNAIVKPVIHGLHSSRVSIINNGVRMQDQEWGAEHAPNLDLNTAGRITVIKGAAALQYIGDAIGGVVISEPIKIPLQDTLFGKTIASTSTNGRGGSLTTSVFKGFDSGWFAQAQGTVKRFGDFEAPDYILSNTGFYERNALARLGLNKIEWGWEAQYSLYKNDIAILRASHLGGAEDLVNAIGSDRPLFIEPFTYAIGRPRQEVTHHIAKVSAFQQLQGVGKIELAYDFQSNRRFEFDIRRGDDANKASVDLRLNTHNVNIGLESEIGDWDFKTGATFNYQNNFANPSTGIRRLIPDYDQYRLGGFLITNWSPSDRWSIEAGARFDHIYMDVFKFYRSSFWEERGYDELFPNLVVEEFGNQILTNPEFNFNNLSVTLGANYELAENWQLYANLSMASRAPNASELFSEGLHHSASRIELGDLRFQSETSNKGVLTLQKKGIISFAVSPFYNWLDNFIVIEPTGVEQTLRGNFQVWEYRQTPAEMLGVDVDFSAQFWKDWEFVHSFSLVKGYERDGDTPLINIPSASFSNVLTYNANGVRASLMQHYVFEQNEFPDTNFEVFIPETQSVEEVDVSTPPPAYQLWDLDVSYQLPFIERGSVEVGLQIENLFNTSYRNYLNRLRYYADDLGRNFMFNTIINF
jgi:iron complex outermembrane receptor protein